MQILTASICNILNFHIIGSSNLQTNTGLIIFAHPTFFKFRAGFIAALSCLIFTLLYYCVTVFEVVNFKKKRHIQKHGMPNTHCRFIFDLEVKQILHRVISFKFYQQRFSFVHCISYASIVSQHRLFWTKAFLQGLLYGTLKFHFINISLLKQWSQFLGWRLFCSCINHSPLLVLCY